MITPPRTLTLVHAVQQPLMEPQFQNLTSLRFAGTTSAILLDEYPISGKSTIKVDMQAYWHEPVDDLSDQPQPVMLTGSTTAFSTPIEPDMIVAKIGGRHEFHDTKHRKVDYTAVATTRFREYFPAAITDDLANITRRSQPQTISILSSARPAAPRVLYVLPTFAWEDTVEDAWNFSRRRGGGLRVYLDRPWFSSGEGELLGAVLWGCPPPQHQQFRSFEVPDVLRSYVTQWGMDPIWNAPALPAEAVPRKEHFRNAVAFGDGLSLDEMHRFSQSSSFSVAGHEVGYDNDRKLWYCDIEMDPGQRLFPVRAPGAGAVSAAIDRGRPSLSGRARRLHSALAGSLGLDHLRPDRHDVARAGDHWKDVSRSGRSHSDGDARDTTAGRGRSGLGAGAIDRALGQPLARPRDALDRSDHAAGARGSRPFRLLVEEFETFATDVSGAQQRRLVYADILKI